MAAVAELLMGPVTQAIGWALVHFIWQGALLALLLVALLHTPGLRSPRLRYVLSFTCLVAMVALPLVTGWVVYTPEGESPNLISPQQPTPNVAAPPPAANDHPAPEMQLSSPALSPAPTPTRDFTPATPPRHEVIADMLRWERIRARVTPYVPGCVFLWLLGVFALGWRNMASWVLAQRLRTHGVEPVPEWITAQVATLSARLGIHRAVACLQTTRLAVPATIGWLKPVILLPVSSLLGLETSQLEAVLAHELAHIRRYDYLANLFQILAETVLFYHPAVWWVSRRMRQERELCCDDMAIQLCTSPAEYAGALARVAQLQQPPTLAMTASGGDLLARIRRLAQSPPQDARSDSGWVGLAVLLGVFAAVAGPNLTALLAQPTDAPPGQRSITFPEWTMGQLMVRPWKSDWQTPWEPHQPAMGTVQIPAGMEVQLVLDNNAVTDLSPLSYLAPEDLQALDFRRTEVQDEQLAHIEGMELRDLDLELTEITNEAIEHFENMTSLERLSVGRTNVNNEGIPRLSDLTELRYLDLNLTGLQDDSFAALENLRALEYLDLWDTEIGDESLRIIGTFEQLRLLGMEGVHITDEGIAHLRNLIHLEGLSLEGTPVSEIGVEQLASLPSLRELDLSGTRVSDDVAVLLKERFTLDRVNLPGQISPGAAALLAGIAHHRGGEKRTIQVEDATSGKPIANASIEVKWGPGSSSRTPEFYWTRPSGDISFYTHRTSLAHVTVYAEGFVSNDGPWDIRTEPAITIGLQPARTVGGTVVNGVGEPVGGVSVALPIVGPRNFALDALVSHSETTREDGTWECIHAPSDLSEFEITLRHSDYITTRYTSDNLSPSRLKSGTERLIIETGFDVSGQVRDEQGKPIVGASIAIMEKRRDGLYVTSTRTARTGEDGWFTFVNQAPEVTKLKINAGGYLPRVEDVPFNGDGPPLEFTLVLGQTLKGRVVDIAGKPIQGVRVETSHRVITGHVDHRQSTWRTVTDGEGRFFWDEAPEEPVSLQFRKEGYAYLAKELTATEEEVVVVMTRPFHLSGRIFDADTGSPIRSAMVTIRQGTSSSPTDSQDVVPSHSLRIDNDGAYTLNLNHIADLSQFTHFQVIVQAPGYVDAETRWIEPAEVDPSIDLPLKPEDPLTGFVVDKDGAPALGALYAVATVSEPLQVENGTLNKTDEERVQTVDDQGRFSIAPREKPYALIVTHEKGIARISQDALQDNATLVLEPWARVEGTVSIGSDAAPDVTVALSITPTYRNYRPNYRLLNTTQSNSDGYYVFERVGAGQAQLGRTLPLRDRDHLYALSKPLYVNPGASLTADLGGTGRPLVGALADGQTLRARSVDLSKTTGLIVRKIDMPWPEGSDDWSAEERTRWYDAWLKTSAGAKIRSGAHRYHFYLDEDGAFRVEDLIPGNYTLSLQLYPGEEGQHRSQLPAIATVNHYFEVPDIEGGRSDEPLDLGALKADFR